MQFSQKAKEHIDSCRFCWMCHHVCPIGNATGLERNTARARALGLSLVARDAIEYSEDIINNVYDGIKILGNGEISKKLTVKASIFSASAKEKIEAVGGKTEVI